MMKLKRLAAIILTTAMLTSLTACSGTGKENNTSNGTSSVVSKNNTDNANSTAPSSSEQSTSADNGNSEVSVPSKTLVLYFSGGNSKNADAISSATQRQNDYYATQYLAVLIHNEVGGELVPIIPTNAYPLGYEDTADQAKNEQNNDERPQFEPLGVNIEDYDTIYIGYPIWWYTLPMIIDTFFDTYDLSGKTIIPFNTHLGSGNSGTTQAIRELEPNATVKEGLAISGNSVFDDSTIQQVKD